MYCVRRKFRQSVRLPTIYSIYNPSYTLDRDAFWICAAAEVANVETNDKSTPPWIWKMAHMNPYALSLSNGSY